MATFLGAEVGRGRRKREVKDMNRKGEAADAILLESQGNGQYIWIYFSFILFYFLFSISNFKNVPNFYHL